MTPGVVGTTALHRRPLQHPWGCTGGPQPATRTGWAKAGGGEAGPQPPPHTPLRLIPLGRGAQEANPPPSKFKVRWKRARLSTQGYTGLARRE